MIRSEQGPHAVVLMTCAVSAVVALGLAGYSISLADWIAGVENETVTAATRISVMAVPALAAVCFAYAAVDLVRYCLGRRVRPWLVIGAYVAGLAGIPCTFLLYLEHITPG